MKDINELIKEYLNAETLEEYDVEYSSNNISNKLANNYNPNIKGYCFNNKRIVANVRNSNIIENARKLTNIHNDDEYDKLYYKSYKIFGVKDIYVRESDIYRNIDEKLKENIPQFLGNIKCENYNVVLTNFFKKEDIIPTWQEALDFIVKLHSEYLNKEKECTFLNNYSLSDFKNSKELLLKMMNNFRELYQDEIDGKILNDIEQYIINIEENANMMKSYFETFNHGDYSYKNMCIVNRNKLCVYDWEFGTYTNPQYDLINFMEYDTQVEKIDEVYVNKIVAYYIGKFKQINDIELDIEVFFKILKCNLYFSFINRLMPRLIMNKKVPLGLSDLLLNNWIALYKVLGV